MLQPSKSILKFVKHTLYNYNYFNYNKLGFADLSPTASYKIDMTLKAVCDKK